jgi:hypothetical protein
LRDLRSDECDRLPACLLPANQFTRVPQVNSVVKNRHIWIKQLERRLAGVRRLPAHRRAAEHADETEHDIEALLKELRAEEGMNAHGIGGGMIVFVTSGQIVHIGNESPIR